MMAHRGPDRTTRRDVIVGTALAVIAFVAWMIAFVIVTR
jgi:hypothetical protein